MERPERPERKSLKIKNIRHPVLFPFCNAGSTENLFMPGPPQAHESGEQQIVSEVPNVVNKKQIARVPPDRAWRNEVGTTMQSIGGSALSRQSMTQI